MAAFHNRETIEVIARNFAELAKKEMDIKNVYLYGSAVKGTSTEDSDIDIAVVGDDFIGDPTEDTFKLLKIRRKIDYRIESRPFRSCEFNKSDPFVKEILPTGIKVL